MVVRLYGQGLAERGFTCGVVACGDGCFAENLKQRGVAGLCQLKQTGIACR